MGIVIPQDEYECAKCGDVRQRLPGDWYCQHPTCRHGEHGQMFLCGTCRDGWREMACPECGCQTVYT